MDFDFDTDSVENLERDLRYVAEQTFPRVVQYTLNRAAFGARKRIQAELKNKMELRNKWTAGSIQYRQAQRGRIDGMASEVGSAAEYMRRQESGFTERAGGRWGVPIPTSYAAGQEGAQPRTKLVRKANRLQRIKLKTKWRGVTIGAGYGAKGGTRKARTDKQRNVRSVQIAVTSGARFIFLKFPRRRGIFRVVGGRKKFKKGWPDGAKLKMVYDLTSRSVTVRPHPWLEPEVEKTIGDLPKIYRRVLLRELKRLGVGL